MTIGVFTHNHTQEEPAEEWLISHMLGTRAPCVDVFIDFEGQLTKILPKDVVVVNPNTVSVQFTAPRTGLAAIR